MVPPPLVFVIDDEEPVRRALQVLLRAEGFAVRAFGTGADAVSAAAQERPDCVLTDFHMPGLNGRDVIQELERRGVPTPVLLMTGRDEPRDLALDERVRVIAKPFDAAALLALLRELLDAHRRS